MSGTGQYTTVTPDAMKQEYEEKSQQKGEILRDTEAYQPLITRWLPFSCYRKHHFEQFHRSWGFLQENETHRDQVRLPRRPNPWSHLKRDRRPEPRLQLSGLLASNSAPLK